MYVYVKRIYRYLNTAENRKYSLQNFGKLGDLLNVAFNAIQMKSENVD